MYSSDFGEYVKFDDSCDSVESGNFCYSTNSAFLACYSANLVILLVVVFLVDAVNLVIVVILVNLQIYI